MRSVDLSLARLHKDFGHKLGIKCVTAKISDWNFGGYDKNLWTCQDQYREGIQLNEKRPTMQINWI